MIAVTLGASVAGGSISGPGSSLVFISGAPVSLLGDQITSHGLPPHDSATIVTGSAIVFVNGLPMTRVGDLASCGDTVSGPPTHVFAD